MNKHWAERHAAEFLWGTLTLRYRLDPETPQTARRHHIPLYLST